MNGAACIVVLLSTIEYPSNVHKRNVLFPEQLSANLDALFSNVVSDIGYKESDG